MGSDYLGDLTKSPEHYYVRKKAIEITRISLDYGPLYKPYGP